MKFPIKTTLIILIIFASFAINSRAAFLHSKKYNAFKSDSSSRQVQANPAGSEYEAVLLSAQVMAGYYTSGQLKRAQQQHQITLESFKKLNPVEQIRAAFEVQSLFENYPTYITEYSEIAFSTAVNNGYVELAAMHLGQIAALYWTKNDFPKAMNAFKKFGVFADPFTTVVPFDTPDTEIIRQDLVFKDFLRRYVRFMFNTYATRHRPLCEQNDCLNLAWETSEKIKSRVFRTEIIRGAINVLSESEKSRAQKLLQEAQQTRLKRINFLSQTNNFANPTIYDKEIDDNSQQLSRLLPGYESLANGSVSLSAINEVLAPNETLLSFFYTDSERPVFVWKIEKDKTPEVITLYNYPNVQEKLKSEDLYYSIELLKDRMKNNPSMETLSEVQCPPNIIGSQPKKKMSCLPWFQKNVILPLKLEPNRRLIIAADQNLSALPFDLLPWNGSQMMLDAFDITFVPSASVFYELRRKHRQGLDSGNSEYKYFYRGFSFENANDPNNKLTWADSEISNAADGLSEPLAIGKTGAQESHLYEASQDLALTRYIHIVAHNNLFSGSDSSFYLQLGGDSTEDGKLTGYEIVTRLRNNAELVILSACQTALRNRPLSEVVELDPHNKDSSGSMSVESGCVCTHGESFSNLSGAFFAAGSKRLMLTQWLLPDTQGTQELVRAFFRYLKGGRSSSEAIRMAKREMRDNYFKIKDIEIRATYNPALWSGFILVGD